MHRCGGFHTTCCVQALYTLNKHKKAPCAVCSCQKTYAAVILDTCTCTLNIHLCLTTSLTGSNIVKRTLTDKDIPLAPPTPQQEKVAPASITIDDALRAEMVGWEVRMLPSNAPLGLVTEVVASMEDIGQHLLRVTRSVASAPIGTHGIDATNQAWDALLASGLEEQHLIPLVPAIVPRIDRAARCLYIDPPSGLLDLGYGMMCVGWLLLFHNSFTCTHPPSSVTYSSLYIHTLPFMYHNRRKQVLLAYLKTALQPFTSQSPSVSEQLAGIRVMPTRKQLLDAGSGMWVVGEWDVGSG